MYSGERGAEQQQEQFSPSTVRKNFLDDTSLLTDEFSLVSNISPCTSLHGSGYTTKSSFRRGGTVELMMTAVILSMTILILVRLLKMIWTLPSVLPPWLGAR